MNNQSIGHKIIRYDETDSSNKMAVRLIENNKAENGTILISNYQTHGKGHGSSTWESEKGKNLTLSIILFPGWLRASEQFQLSKVVSLAIIDVLNSYINGFRIKWPNDIYYGDKKIAGILIENSIQGNSLSSSVIGIGLNVNQERFTSNAPNPISLFQLLNERSDLDSLLEKLIISLNEKVRFLQEGKNTEINRYYLRNLYRYQEVHEYQTQEGKIKAMITGIGRYGVLEIQSTDGVKKEFGFKEIEYLI